MKLQVLESFETTAVKRERGPTGGSWDVNYLARELFDNSAQIRAH